MEHHEHSHHHTAEPEQLPSDPAGLPEATAPELVGLGDGDKFEVRIASVATAYFVPAASA